MLDESTRIVDEQFMREALAQARQAADHGEVPVGAVVVIDQRIVATGFNSPIFRNDPTAHAEILAIRDAAQHAQNYRLPDATLYVTLEPCPMCAGAIVQARIARVVFGARDIRFGGVPSKFTLADNDLLNHKAVITEGILAADCLHLLQRFFNTRRETSR